MRGAKESQYLPGMKLKGGPLDCASGHLPISDVDARHAHKEAM